MLSSSSSNSEGWIVSARSCARQKGSTLTYFRGETLASTLIGLATRIAAKICAYT